MDVRNLRERSEDDDRPVHLSHKDQTDEAPYCPEENKSINWTSLKLRPFALKKASLLRGMKRQARGSEKIFVKHVSDKRLVSRIYKEL